MNRKLLVVTMALALGALTVQAGNTIKSEWSRTYEKRIDAYAITINTNIAGALARYGLTDAEQQRVVASGYDENVILELAFVDFATRASLVVEQRMSAGIRALLKKMVLASDPANKLFDCHRFYVMFPVEERADLRTWTATNIAMFYPGQPAAASIELEDILTMDDANNGGASLDMLVGALLAPEMASIQQANQFKYRISQVAIALARQALRAQGKTFVLTKDGGNPLEAVVKPVLTALNAPMCDGLEKALRDLGATVTDKDRDALPKTTGDWQLLIMTGDDSSLNWHLGKIQIVLGAEGYNRWIKEYNEGASK